MSPPVLVRFSGPADVSLALPASAAAVDKHGRVRIGIANREPFAVRATVRFRSRLRLRALTRTARPGATTTLTVRLSRAQQRRLRRLGRVRVTAVAALRDASGASRTIRRTFTLRARRR